VKGQAVARSDGQLLPSIFAALFGAFLGLTFLKFGNPPILEKFVSIPKQFYDYVFGYPWPIAWGYWGLGIVGMLGVVVARWKPAAPKWLLALPLVWLIWEFIASTKSVSAELTAPTVKHFAACVLCFYLGLFALSRVRNPWPFWAGLLCGLLLVLQAGWDQHFGGLQATRRYFYLYFYQEMKEIPPEYLKRISSSRIFATLFYPNALAGLLLLVLPGALGVIWEARRRLTAPARGLLLILVAAPGLACLCWSGSKGGWLLMLLLGLMVLLRLPFSRQLKIALIAAVLLGGLAGFFWKYSAFFQKGATSVSARFDYWRAALQTAKDNPAFGTGPGTFAIPYAKIKRPESEMARLVHDDYLEQASDSGLVGFVAYTVFMAGALAYTFPRADGRARHSVRAAESGGTPPVGPVRAILGAHGVTRPTVRGTGEWLRFTVWLGVLGWSLQGFVEFGLYIPALAWPAFTLLGWLLGVPNGVDKSQPAL
jgi:O-antigen ligase